MNHIKFHIEWEINPKDCKSVQASASDSSDEVTNLTNSHFSIKIVHRKIQQIIMIELQLFWDSLKAGFWTLVGRGGFGRSFMARDLMDKVVYENQWGTT